MEVLWFKGEIIVTILIFTFNKLYIVLYSLILRYCTYSNQYCLKTSTLQWNTTTWLSSRFPLVMQHCVAHLLLFCCHHLNIILHLESQAKQQMNKSIEMDGNNTWLEIVGDVILLALRYTGLCIPPCCHQS